MKKIFSAILLGVLFVAGFAHADSTASLTTTSSATVPAYFGVKGSALALTSSPTTIMGPGVLLEKLIFWPSVDSANNVTVTVYDTGSNVANGAQNGLTSTAQARQILKTIVLAGVPTSPYIIDFQTQSGVNSSNNGGANGLLIKGYLAVVESGTNTPNAMAVYQPWIRNVIQGNAGN